ncbi:RNA polymerase II largest subunit [Mycena rebaudengoi]|nr:RNA polymerase II largest subunit [Mycena rebaudengoi]
MAGREGLIDTAIKTAKTGYILRQITFVYGEDSMDGAFIEKQGVDTFALNDEQFRHNHRVDVADERGGFVSSVLQVRLDDSSLELQAKLDEEYRTLFSDRQMLRTFIFPHVDPTTNFYLPVNPQCIVQNATQIFHIDCRQPSDLEPAYIIDAVEELGERLIIRDAVLRLRMHPCATFAACHVLERFHLNREVFDWLAGREGYPQGFPSAL